MNILRRHVVVRTFIEDAKVLGLSSDVVARCDNNKAKAKNKNTLHYYCRYGYRSQPGLGIIC